MRPDLRVGAYAVCWRGDQLLLARWTGPRGPEWTLPGGGLDHGEHPRDAAVREVREETGYDVSLDRLLTVDSFHGVIREAPEPGEVAALVRVPLVDIGLTARHADVAR